MWNCRTASVVGKNPPFGRIYPLEIHPDRHNMYLSCSKRDDSWGVEAISYIINANQINAELDTSKGECIRWQSELF